jgi:hypothetical protein
MWVLQFIHHRDVVEFDIQVLVNTLESTADRDVILQFDLQAVYVSRNGIVWRVVVLARLVPRITHGDFMVNQCFEEAEEQHDGVKL